MTVTFVEVVLARVEVCGVERGEVVEDPPPVWESRRADDPEGSVVSSPSIVVVTAPSATSSGELDEERNPRGADGGSVGRAHDDWWPCTARTPRGRGAG